MMAFLAVFWRDMIRYVRFKAQLFSSLIQPVIWMIFFGMAMSSNFDKISDMIHLPPGVYSVDYLTFMSPGVIAMTVLFTSLFGGLTLLFDKNWGLMREMMASPMPRVHILWGISLSGMVKSFVQVTIIIITAMALGVEFFHDYTLQRVIISILGITAFVGIFSLGFIFLSASITMRLQSMEGVQGIMTLLTMPIFFSSGALYPVDNFPEWLKALAMVNPLTYLVRGIRYFLLGNDFYAMGAHYTYTSGEIMWSFIYLLVFAAIFYVIAWRTFKNAVVV